MKDGSIVLAAFQQADGNTKLRPAVILKKTPPFDDYVICAISSQLHNYVQGLDIIIDQTHIDFISSGLKSASIVRTAMVATVPSGLIKGAIGQLGSNTYTQLIKQLTAFLENG